MHIATFKKLLAYADNNGMGTTSTAVENFYFRCRLLGCTDKTLAVYAERLGYLLRYAQSINKPLEKLVKHDLQRYIDTLIDRVSPITVNGRIQVFRVFYRHLQVEGFVEVDPATGISKLQQPRTIKRVVTPDDLSRILAQLNRRSFIGARDHALILLTFDAMLRLSEVLSIQTHQLDLRSGVLQVKGKGRKERFVAFSPTTAQSVHTYVTRFRTKIPANNGDLLFCTRHGGLIGHRYAQRIFSNPARKIGLRLHPHLARHSGATAFVRAGGPLAVLQRALGHSTLRVTERYIHVDDSDLRKAYERYSPAAGVRI